MANIYSLQLLRNGSIFPNYEAAVTAITGSTVQDGVIKLARYKGASTDSGNTKYSTDVVKTVFGIYAAMEGNSGWTLFDSYHEIIADLQRQIDAMGGESGSIRDQILAEIAKLDYSDYVTGDSKVVTSVTETDGVVAAAGENIANIKLADYTKGEDASKVAATDTLGEALSKLEKQVEVVSANTANVISGLDYSDSAVEGEYVSQVTETDGVINVTRVALPTVAPISEAGKPIVAVSETKGAVSAATGTINAEFVNVADADNNFTASTVETVLAEIKSGYTAADQALKTEILGGASASADTLGELETLINNLGADAATYTVKKVTTGLATNVKEQYVLVETKNGESTDKEVAIPIYKDNTLKSVELVNQALQFTYIVDSGESVVSVDVSKFLAESEFASGVTVNSDGVAHGVVDPTSEKDANNNPFLTVGADGFKLAGVQAAIDAASGDVKTKLDELSAKTETLSGKAVTEITSTDGSIATAKTAAADGTISYNLSTDASKVKVSSAYAAGTNAPIATGDTLDVALAKLEKQVAAANASVQKDANATHLTVTTETGPNGETIYTIGESDIASASALTAEIAARKAVDGVNGDAYTADTNANYISGASNLYGADQALDTALKAVADSASSAQTEIDAIETAVGLDANGNHIPSTGKYTSNADSIEGEIVALDGQVKTNTDNIAALSGKTITGITMNGTGVTVTNNVAALTATGKQTAATATNNEAIVVETDANGGLTLGIASLDAGTY